VNTKERILVVEDEINISKLVKLNLEMEGYEVNISANGKDALKQVEEAHYDLVVLDLMLPELDGIKVLQRLKLNFPLLPVIITSAKDTSKDRIKGLKAGAEDYLIKPYNLEELIIRIHKLLERFQEKDADLDNVYKFGSNQINFSSYEAKGIDGTFQLTKKEILLLKMLIEKKNQVVSREEMLKNVWGYDVYPSTRTIDNFIMSLRKYFEVDPRNPEYILSIRGVGYKFVTG
jgi:two-component system alkaline phosphatase synthesis response regulator PhoP